MAFNGGSDWKRLQWMHMLSVPFTEVFCSSILIMSVDVIDGLVSKGQDTSDSKLDCSVLFPARLRVKHLPR